MAMPQVRRSRGRNLTVVNPTREFEDIYDRMGQLMNLAFGLAPVDVAEGPWIPLADLSETDDAYAVEVDLPGDVNADAVNAQLSNGVLTVTIPKSEEAKPRQIEIKG
jgi:HSP20 family protein